MSNAPPFKWRHFEADSILPCVRWYLRYSLSYRDLEEMMLERGLQIDHTTIYRCVLSSAPALERRSRPYLKVTIDSWRVDERYVKVKWVWMYLYRAVDSQGNTLEFHLSPTRDAEAAKRFFSKTLAAPHTVAPRVITVNKNAACPKAFRELKAEGALPQTGELRQVKHLNNLVEQDHWFMKRLVKPGMGFFSFETAFGDGEHVVMSSLFGSLDAMAHDTVKTLSQVTLSGAEWANRYSGRSSLQVGSLA